MFGIFNNKKKEQEQEQKQINFKMQGRIVIHNDRDDFIMVFTPSEYEEHYAAVFVQETNSFHEAIKKLSSFHVLIEFNNLRNMERKNTNHLLIMVDKIVNLTIL